MKRDPTAICNNSPPSEYEKTFFKKKETHVLAPQNRQGIENSKLRQSDAAKCVKSRVKGMNKKLPHTTMET